MGKGLGKGPAVATPTRAASMDKRYFPLAGVLAVLLLLAFATWPKTDGGSHFSGLTSSSTARALVDPATVSYGSVDPARGKLLQVQLVFRCASPTSACITAPHSRFFYKIFIVQCTTTWGVATPDQLLRCQAEPQPSFRVLGAGTARARR